MNLDISKLIEECTFTAARSSGSGGQNVNKVSTKIILAIHIEHSSVLSDKEKALIAERLKNRINKDGFLLITNDTERTQFLNKKAAIAKLNLLLIKSLKENKKRIDTKPTQKSIQDRLDNKKKQAEKKKLRSDKMDY